MKTVFRPVHALLVVAMTSLAACGSASSDWSKASAANTSAAYQQFINEHPSDVHTSEAKALIAQLEDNQAWASAQQTPGLAGYQSYLDEFPQGTNAPTAQAAMAGLSRASDWKIAQAGGAPELRSFLQKYSSGPEVDEAKTKLKALTAFHARLATESSNMRAQKRMTELQSKLSPLKRDLQVVPGADSKSFVVESGGMTEEEASAMCQSVKKAASRCQSVQE